MNYYPHNIGDYSAATSHLSLLEDAVYRRMLDRYYLSEEPLPADINKLCRLVRATTMPERAAVKAVADEFFTHDGDTLRQIRCDEEILKYQHNAEKNKANGKKGGRPANSLKVPQGTKPSGLVIENPVGLISEPSGLLEYENNETQTKGKQNQETITNNQEEEKAIGGSDDHAYSETFLKAWDRYPKRHGDNPKRTAFQAWNARLKAGRSELEMLAGVARYAVRCEQDGKIGTEFIMQAKRFFGPDEPFKNAWDAAAEPKPKSAPVHETRLAVGEYY
jgi:uncharacterized protein YdaU (DUF1376 family)